jgi:Protein of unknown function (DUF3810)
MLPKTIKQYFWPITLLFFVVLIKVFSANKDAVEMYYSTSSYASFASFYRAIFARVPFSVGDVLYTIAICYLLVKIFHFCRALCSKERRKLLQTNWKASAKKTFHIILIIYLLFNILWGLNYNRIGIAEQLNLTKEKYTIDDLKAINFLLVQKINENKLVLLSKNENTITTNEMFLKTKIAYDSAAIKYPFLAYRNPSIKKSMFTWFCNYAKIYGYYNPFTAEANINVDVPAFTQPFTTCHEVAHQLGYAKEMEANFVGYFAAKSSGDAYFKYSTYTDLFSYANNTLYYADTSAAFAYSKLLLPAVVKDFKERRKFNNAHGGPLEPFIKLIYGKFLEQNEQPLGILSYNEVTSFIIGYHKKFKDL